MNRDQRALLAQETLNILANGHYQVATQTQVEIGEQIQHCVSQTQLFLPETLNALLSTLPTLDHALASKIEVVNETSLSGASRLAKQQPERVAVLNFASAKNPGGGFLGGSQAQEESLARSSALYASQTSAAANPFYEFHRQQGTCFYSDRALLSPACPVFRQDDGGLLQQPYLVDFITCAAPNAGAIARNEPEQLSQVASCFQQRLELVLALAVHANCRYLVLGAWGCGVFANDKQMVAQAFAHSLLPGGRFAGRFEQIVFSVLDRGASASTFDTFARALKM